MAETEMKKRMLMESAYNLEVDMACLGLDELEVCVSYNSFPFFLFVPIFLFIYIHFLFFLID